MAYFCNKVILANRRSCNMAEPITYGKFEIELIPNIQCPERESIINIQSRIILSRLDQLSIGKF